jgi:predicted ArsR family transcriptional regulator
VELTIPERRYRQLALGLLAVLPVVADDDRALLAAVRQAGLEEGKAAAVDSVAEAVAWLNHRGYRASVTDGDGAAVLELGNCVFAHPATVSPEVVCAYDQALLRGLFEDSGAALRQLASVVDGEPLCRMELLLPG